MLLTGRPKVGYTAPAPPRWLLHNSQVMPVWLKKGNYAYLSPDCPFYCDSAVLQSGLTLDESTRNQQCINDHRGVLCSECPSGYSSVFGSYKCKECSSAWLLQLPLHALGGILILAGLFFLNFTLLQETIMGVVMHTNMGLKGDFLQEHAWGPLLFILSVLSLKSGAIVPNLVSEHVFIMTWMSSGRLYCSLPSPSTSSPSSQSSSDDHCHSQVQLYVQDVRKGLFHGQESCISTGHHGGLRWPLGCWIMFEAASTSHPCGHPHIH